MTFIEHFRTSLRNLFQVTTRFVWNVKEWEMQSEKIDELMIRDYSELF